MDRRKVLLVVAAVIAALGTLLVFLYVRGADTRADAQYGAVTVLRATKQIAPGETVAAAQAAGKFAVLPDAWTEEGGQLTPSLKLKRGVVMREHRDDVDALYVR